MPTRQTTMTRSPPTRRRPNRLGQVRQWPNQRRHTEGEPTDTDPNHVVLVVASRAYTNSLDHAESFVHRASGFSVAIFLTARSEVAAVAAFSRFAYVIAARAAIWVVVAGFVAYVVGDADFVVVAIWVVVAGFVAYVVGDADFVVVAVWVVVAGFVAHVVGNADFVVVAIWVVVAGFVAYVVGNADLVIVAIWIVVAGFVAHVVGDADVFDTVRVGVAGFVASGVGFTDLVGIAVWVAFARFVAHGIG